MGALRLERLHQRLKLQNLLLEYLTLVGLIPNRRGLYI